MLYVFLVLLKFAELRSLYVTLLLLLLDPNRQMPCGGLKLLCTNLVVSVSLDFRNYFLHFYYDLPWIPSPWLQNYVVMHKLGWWDCYSLFHLVYGTTLNMLAEPEPP